MSPAPEHPHTPDTDTSTDVTPAPEPSPTTDPGAVHRPDSGATSAPGPVPAGPASVSEPSATSSPPPSPKIQEALDARDALAAALTRAGVQLPAMDIRTPWVYVQDSEPRYALVQLGVCSAPVAHALAAALNRGTAA